MVTELVNELVTKRLLEMLTHLKKVQEQKIYLAHLTGPATGSLALQNVHFQYQFSN